MTTGITLDQTDVAAAVARARRKHAIVGLALVMPALLYLCVAFVFPIISVFLTSISNGDVARQLPTATAVLAGWRSTGHPTDAMADALIQDLRNADRGEIARIARDLNNRIGGYRTLLIASRAAVANDPRLQGITQLSGVDARWDDPVYWTALRNATAPATMYYLLAAVDLREGDQGWIEQAPQDRRIYLQFLVRTFSICLMVTLICAILGYPVAYFISQASPRAEKVLLFLLLIPFWTSVLVRTAAWVIVLQRDGLVNSLLMSLNLTSEPLTMIYNRFGVYVAMTHVLLPFMVLPIYSVMKSINPQLVSAALSLGARPLVAFWKIYLPLSLPGLSAGAVMVFVLGLGYYVTPALVGGPTDQMESGLIADFALGSANWPMASAVSLVLLVVTSVLFLTLKRILRISNLSIG